MVTMSARDAAGAMEGRDGEGRRGRSFQVSARMFEVWLRNFPVSGLFEPFGRKMHT